MKFNRQHILGLTLAFTLALGALYAAGLPWFSQLGLSALTLAIVGGMVLGNTVYPRIAVHSHAGIAFAKGHILRLGIIMFGFKLTFQDIAAVGVGGSSLQAAMSRSYWSDRRPRTGSGRRCLARVPSRRRGASDRRWRWPWQPWWCLAPWPCFCTRCCFP